MKIFGREPALWVGLIGAALTLVGTLGIGLTGDQAVLWTTAIGALSGAVTAAMTRPLAPGAFLGFVAAAVPLLAAYGFKLSDETVTALNGLILVALPLIVRGQVTPSADPQPEPTVVV